MREVMALTRFQRYLVGLMLFSGTLFPVLLNITENLTGRGTYENHDGNAHRFSHPFFMIAVMFLGEFSCLFIYVLVKWARSRDAPIDRDGGKFNPLVFLPAAIIDLVQMSLLNLGLGLVLFAQITPFQIMKGVALVFTALLSVAFLAQSFGKEKWLGMMMIVLGLLIIGLPNLLKNIEDDDKIQHYSLIAGELFIAMSQMLSAVQLVYEEYWIHKCNILPLAVVGWEGLFGSVAAIGMVIGFHRIKAKNFSHLSSQRLEDVLDALKQISSSWKISLSVVSTVICFTLFRFAGVSLTRQWNATTRIVFECFCTVFVWLVLTPQRHWVSEMNYTPVGVILLVLGFSAFYNFVFFRWLCQCPTIKCKKRENKELLLSEEQDGNVGDV